MAETLSQVTMRIWPWELEGLSPERLAKIEKAIDQQSAQLTEAARAASFDSEHAKVRALQLALDLRRNLARAA